MSVPLPSLIDLASARVGGRAIVANDEFFAPKRNLVSPRAPVFLEGRYTDRGKWMDGWETRRRREPGHDWCVIRLGIPGEVHGATVDTAYFRGNYPEACSLDALTVARTVAPRALATHSGWTEILPRAPLRGDAANRFSIAPGGRVTHVRLNIHPDGGVARLHVWGEARPDWRRLARNRRAVDLVAVTHGGLPLATSDQFFSNPLNLLMPDAPTNMGDGWETRRRRGPGHDWVVIRLGHRGIPARVEIDTTHFKGNFPESASLDGCDTPALDPRSAPGDDAPWRELLPRIRLRADARHMIPLEGGAMTHLRLNIFPDGGVARLRLFGKPA